MNGAICKEGEATHRGFEGEGSFEDVERHPEVFMEGD